MSQAINGDFRHPLEIALEDMGNKFTTGNVEALHAEAAMPINRRTSTHRNQRRLVLSGNLMATILEQIDTDADNAFARQVRYALEAWDHAVEDIRQDHAGAAAGRWTTTPGAQS